jgi:predicted NBD/HSP70 family sugar kinase
MSFPTGSTGLPRDLNRASILRLIAAAGPIARTHIARRLGLSPATVTSVTRELLDQGLLRVAEVAPSKGGRPALLLEIVGAAATAFGVKVAPDHLVGVQVDLDAEVLARFEEPFEPSGGDAPARLAAILRRWLDAGAGAAPVLGVGLGVPGIAHDLGRTVESPMLGWRGLALAAEIEDEVGVPVLVDNDVNTLAVAEHLYGRGRERETFVTVTIGRGVGAAFFSNGQLVRGRGGAAELGHIPLVAGGPLCACGKRGCLEALVADPALVRAAREQGLEVDDIEALRAAAAGGDVRANGVFDLAGEHLGRAVATVTTLLDPELVLLSGEGIASWPWLRTAFERSYAAEVFAPLRDVPVEVDPWDDAKWARGAAALILQAPFSSATGRIERVRERLGRGAAVSAVAG